jgi:hypothetical protein
MGCMAEQWVVFKARATPDGQAADSRRTKWVQAWCLLGAGPGFDDIRYVELDGFTPAILDDADPAPVLEQHLFTARRPPS